MTAFIPATGTRLWERDFTGTQRAKVVSEDGNLVALGPANERYYRYGRNRTKLVIVGSSALPQSFNLRGNFEPEAFSTDGTNLFVLQYRPARNPSTYQVRRLDLSTGRLHDVYTPDAHLQKAMRGDARVQTVSLDGRRLYTLYTLRGPSGTHAFIHVLALDEMWAHCIDLPATFGVSASTAALTVAPDGKSLYVANAATDAIAEIDPATLSVVRTAETDFGVPRETQAAVGPDRRLFLASGPSLSSVDLVTLEEERDWVMSSRITGIQTADDTDRLYVAVQNRVVVIDVSTGKRVKTLDPPGVGKIAHLGRITETINDIPKNLTCAC